MIRTQMARVLLFLGITILQHNVVQSSLLEGTLVATAHGLVTIESLKIGDLVLGFDLNAPSYSEALCEVAVTKKEKHLTDSLFTLCTETGWVEASPHQLIFTLMPTPQNQDDARVMDFVQAQYVTKEFLLIDAHMNCLPITETNKMKLTCSFPDQYIEIEKLDKHKRVIGVSRRKVRVDMYALEVEAPHVFLIGENPHVKDITTTRLLPTHNGIPALAAGVSLVFDATPASLAFGEATASIGGLGVVFGPAGVALGALTGIGFIGYQLFKSDKKSQAPFYIERAGPGSPGGMDPKEPKDDEGKQIAKRRSDELVNNALRGTEPGRETNGRTKQFEKPGGFDKALEDFDNMGVTDIRSIPNGKMGKLPDGRCVNVRTESSAKKPTLEIYNGKSSIKIRYGN